jgi:hypothetical protein
MAAEVTVRYALHLKRLEEQRIDGGPKTTTPAHDLEHARNAYGREEPPQAVIRRLAYVQN